MRSKGKFILVDIEEFRGWIDKKVVMRPIEVLQVHHTYKPDYQTMKEHPDIFDNLFNMEYYHVHERGFEQIAQNLTIYPDGTIAICRDLGRAPAGIKGANSKGICIEIVGNFDSGHDEMDSEQKQAVVSLYALLCIKFKLKPSVDTIVYHHWYDLVTGKRCNGRGITKSCPGTNYFGGNSVEKAQNFIGMVEARMEILKLD